ncbi:hypothetical protein UFOVP75_22 [uncultured Caudovirales phage]|uniref:Uncharacterized protein n=1 Tax=uncultured Caudovirales phage TaxID=2100421 RepID=A0A6J5KVX8_9CAUD|nr:hypothetical protein UFOVP75_22 [uncultured Caudovirales phage]
MIKAYFHADSFNFTMHTALAVAFVAIVAIVGR